jgi:hypothetical protein
VRAFWLTLFVIGALVVLRFGWTNGEPWTASAFVVFFASRVARSLIKRPLNGVQGRLRADDARRFLLVTTAGWLGSAALAAGAALAGEGQEWLYVAPCFLIFGLLNLWLLIWVRSSAGDRTA